MNKHIITAVAAVAATIATQRASSKIADKAVNYVFDEKLPKKS